jgi:hypothetical protein
MPSAFSSTGKFITGPQLPDLPESLKKRMAPQERDKWDRDREKYNKEITLMLRGGS